MLTQLQNNAHDCNNYTNSFEKRLENRKEKRKKRDQKIGEPPMLKNSRGGQTEPMAKPLTRRIST
jgi:hypothetical protein